MTKAYLIPADIQMSCRIISVNGLEDLQSAVGGNIEGLRLNNYIYSYCNEEGKLLGLPVNSKATVVVNLFAIQDVICGDFLILGAIDKDGDDTDIPPQAVQFFNNMFRGNKNAIDAN